MAKLVAHPGACKVIAMYYYDFDSTQAARDLGFERNLGLGLFWTLQWKKGGSSMAMYVLGMMYTDNHRAEVPPKRKEGVRLLRGLCEGEQEQEVDPLSHIETALAQVRIGQCYSLGNGVKVDKQEAMRWYRLPAEAGDADAQSCLGGLLKKGGEGVGRNREEAIVWCRKAAEQGIVEAQANVGMLLMQIFENPEIGRLGPHAAEATEGMKWLRVAAERGFVQAQCSLAACLKDGLGVAKDPTEAVFWLRKSADQGHAKAQFGLGLTLLQNIADAGEEIRPDTAEAMEAVKWYRTAAEQGNAQAEYHLSMCLKEGEGVEKNLTEAVFWCRRSAEQGFAVAQFQLGMLLIDIIGETHHLEAMQRDGVPPAESQLIYPAELVETVKWFRKSAEQGYAEAQRSLAIFLKNGYGVAKDLVKAREWYHRSVIKGPGSDARAQYQLGAKD
eukprot:TRINITY_DN103_c1_g2_i1.p1 TRINITY_DN103_c1_g2~~TRINITY_DN103_c1_g2_i1.p1  ORF type:complete len:504 (+),score=84.00 TRINITY_DN103_c1_g2_i1:184-1512(+)